jgi:hypothetical protein
MDRGKVAHDELDSCDFLQGVVQIHETRPEQPEHLEGSCPGKRQMITDSYSAGFYFYVPGIQDLKKMRAKSGAVVSPEQIS